MDGEMIGYIVIAVFIQIMVNLLVGKIKDYWQITHSRSTGYRHISGTTGHQNTHNNLSEPNGTTRTSGGNTNTRQSGQSLSRGSTSSRGLPRPVNGNIPLSSFPQCPLCRTRNRQGFPQTIFQEPGNRWRCINHPNDHYFES